MTPAESDAPEDGQAAAATEADAAETDAAEEPATETPASDVDPSESASADGDQAPMVDPVEDTDDSATTDDQAPLVDPVEETDESAPAATEDSAPAEEPWRPCAWRPLCSRRAVRARNRGGSRG